MVYDEMDALGIDRAADGEAALARCAARSPHAPSTAEDLIADKVAMVDCVWRVVLEDRDGDGPTKPDAATASDDAVPARPGRDGVIEKATIFDRKWAAPKFPVAPPNT